MSVVWLWFLEPPLCDASDPFSVVLRLDDAPLTAIGEVVSSRNLCHVSVF